MLRSITKCTSKRRGLHLVVTSLTSEHIVIDRIKVDPDSPPIHEETVRQLMQSIERLGLLQPIILHRPGTGLGVQLICGRTRLEACKRLKHRTILSRVVNGNPEGIVEWCERAAIDENLVRRATSFLRSSETNVISMVDRQRSSAAIAS
jgi:ParB-like chromosome segregation protein Spo0J